MRVDVVHGQLDPVVIGHLDTVFEPDSPFQTFTRKGDLGEGPGAGDDKGGMVVVVAALRAYRRGMLRVSPAAAQLRVLGTFPLDDTDLALKALADTLPITVDRYRSGWMVVIDVKPGAPRPQA